MQIIHTKNGAHRQRWLPQMLPAGVQLTGSSGFAAVLPHMPCLLPEPGHVRSQRIVCHASWTAVFRPLQGGIIKYWERTLQGFRVYKLARI